MKKLLSCFLALLMVLPLGTTAFAVEAPKNEPYILKNSQCGEDALAVITDNDVSDYFVDIKNKEGLTVVSATEQTVYVIETIDSIGSVTESRLMNTAEVEKYEKMLSSAKAGVSRANTWVGDDDETHQGGKLSIYLVVYKDSSNKYLAYGTANWANGVYHGGVNGPSSGYDFIAITWGGGGELKTLDKSISGEYQYDQGAISFSRAQSDTYKGYCWQFNEMTGAYFANYIDCYAKIGKTYTTNQHKETNVRLTYIHTYQQTVGSVSFEGGTEGAAVGVSLSSCDKQWQLEIDVAGLTY